MTNSTKIIDLPPDVESFINSSIKNESPAIALAQYYKSNRTILKPMPVETVRIGKFGGLPFNFLSTDIHSGCLPISSICYGNCSQALLTLEQGYNFGDRKLNHFDIATIRHDLSKLPSNQKWLRQGWASDISLSKQGWKNAAILGELINAAGKVMVILTKVFTNPSRDVLLRLARTNTEIRVSISPLDKNKVLRKRLDFVKQYHELGGIAVPYLMTSIYKNETIKQRQEDILQWIIESDLPGAEHPLRFNSSNPLTDLIDISQSFAHPKFPHQRWFGNLYPETLLLPAPPSLTPSYPGLNANKASFVNWQKISRFFNQGTPSNSELRNGTANLQHPNLHRHGTLHLSTMATS